MSVVEENSTVSALKELLANGRVDFAAHRNLPPLSPAATASGAKPVLQESKVTANGADAASGTLGDDVMSSNDERSIKAAVHAVCASSPAASRARLETLSRVKLLTETSQQTSSSAATNALLANESLRACFSAPKKQSADLYLRVVEKSCREVIANNAAVTADLRDCHSCLTPGQHAAYRPVVTYYTLTSRTDYAKAVLSHQWPCSDRQLYEHIATAANGVFTLFPDTPLVLDLVSAERTAYLQKVKRLYLTRCRREGRSRKAVNNPESSSMFRNPNYLQTPHVHGLAQRRRRQRIQENVVNFLDECQEHRSALEACCTAWRPPVEVSSREKEGTQQEDAPHNDDCSQAPAPKKRTASPAAVEEEAFDFFEEEGEAPTPVPPPTTTQAPPRTPGSSKKVGQPSAKASSNHIQTEVHRIVWSMDAGQFRGRYVDRQVPAVTVSARPWPPLQSPDAKGAMAPPTRTSSAPRMIDCLPDFSTLDSEEHMMAAIAAESGLTQLVRKAWEQPQRWFLPRLQRDTLADASAGAVPLFTPTGGATAGTASHGVSSPAALPMLTAPALAALVSEVALNMDMAALQALLKLPINRGGNASSGMRIPVRVHAIPDDGGDEARTHSHRSPGSPGELRVRLQVCLGRPLPPVKEARRDITTAALTALLDSTVAASRQPATFLARFPGGTDMAEGDASPVELAPTTAIRVRATPSATDSAYESPLPARSSATDVELLRREEATTVPAAEWLSGPVTPARVAPTKSAAASQVSVVAPPPVRIPFRVFTEVPWSLDEAGETGAPRRVFRLVKAEYLNATDAADDVGLIPAPPHAEAEGPACATPCFLEAMSIDEAVELSAVFHGFPDALVLVCRINAYTGAILATDAWDAPRWEAFLNTQQACEATRQHHLRHSESTPAASRPKRPRTEDDGAAADGETTPEKEALAATPPPLALSSENLTFLEHAWDVLFDVLDRLCLQLTTLCAQQLATFDPHKVGPTSPSTPLLTLDYILSKSNVNHDGHNTTTQAPGFAPAAQRTKRTAQPRLFKVSLHSPDDIFKTYSLPYSLDTEVQTARFVEPPTLTACHQQYLPAGNWPYAERIPFTFQP